MTDMVPPVYTTDLGRVRLLIPDTDQYRDLSTGEDKYILTDEQVQAFLDLNNGSIRRAAADACETIGSNELMIGKVITTEDLATDASKVAAEFRQRAASLRTQADISDPTRPDGMITASMDDEWCLPWYMGAVC